jgi:predicted nucleic acid-binding protein
VLYIDSNILIVYLTNMPPEHGSGARAFFQDLSVGTIVATTTEGVLVEVIQVLASPKGLAYPRKKISEELKRILSFRGLRMEHLELHLRALDRFATTNLDYVDCILVEYAGGPDDAVVSFDRDYDRVRSGLRHEPTSNS